MLSLRLMKESLVHFCFALVDYCHWLVKLINDCLIAFKYWIYCDDWNVWVVMKWILMFVCVRLINLLNYLLFCFLLFFCLLFLYFRFSFLLILFPILFYFYLFCVCVCLGRKLVRYILIVWVGKLVYDIIVFIWSDCL